MAKIKQQVGYSSGSKALEAGQAKFRTFSDSLKGVPIQKL